MQKKCGNAAFKGQKFPEAADFYKDAIELVAYIEKDDQKLKDLKVACHQNLAMCLNQTEDYVEAIYHCSQATELNSLSAKAYYIKSQAYSKQQEWEAAITELKACIMLQPNDRKLRVELEKLAKEKQKAN